MDSATWKLFKYVNKYSAAFWGSSFIKELGRVDLGSDSYQPAAARRAKPLRLLQQRVPLPHRKGWRPL